MAGLGERPVIAVSVGTKDAVEGLGTGGELAGFTLGRLGGLFSTVWAGVVWGGGGEQVPASFVRKDGERVMARPVGNVCGKLTPRGRALRCLRGLRLFAWGATVGRCIWLAAMQTPYHARSFGEEQTRGYGFRMGGSIDWCIITEGLVLGVCGLGHVMRGGEAVIIMSITVG